MPKFGKYYIIKCFIDVKVESTIYGKANGVLGVDTNLGFWSVADISSDGNLLSTTNINYDWHGSKGQTTARIRDAAKELVDIALKTGKPIVIEDLKIQASSKNKAYNSSKLKNRTINTFSYDKMTEALISKAHKCGVEVYVVKPYYTSLIGKIKFMPHYKLPIHNLAAYAIGRRYLQLNERVPKKLKKTSWKDVYKMKAS